MATRSLNYLGGRQIMCKSGKDRTAMAITLEQSILAKKLLDIDSNKDKDESIIELANLLREFGVRIQIAEKNIGRKMYSFNIIQRMSLPKEFRPPLSVIQDLSTSYTHQDS